MRLSKAVVTSGGGVDTLPAVAIVVIQVAIVVTSALTSAISALSAHWLTTGASAAAVEASMFGQVASIFDAKSAQKPSRATDGSAPDGIVIRRARPGMAPRWSLCSAQAETQSTAPPRSPRSERRYDMGNLTNWEVRRPYGP